MLNTQKLLKAFRESPTSCILLLTDSPRFTILEASNTYCSLLGIKAIEIIGKGAFEVFPDPTNEDKSIDDALRSDDFLKVINSRQSIKRLSKRYDIYSNITGQIAIKYWDTEITPLFNEANVVETLLLTVTDVTDKKLLSEKIYELEHSEFLHINEGNESTGVDWEIGSWEYKPSIDKMIFSDEALNLYGFDKNSNPLSLQKVTLAIHPDDRERRKIDHRLAIEQGIKYRAKYRIIKPDGNIVWLLSTAVPIKNEEGKVVRINGLIQNINKNIEREALLMKTVSTLKEINEFIEKVLHNLPIGISVNRISDGELTIANKNFFQTYGWEEKDFTNVKEFFRKVYPNETYRQEISNRISEDIKSGIPERMVWDNISVATNQGESRIINAKNISLPEQDLMISTVIDVTDKDHTLKLLEESNKRYELATKATADAIWDLNWETKEILWSENFQTLFGFSKEDMSEDGYEFWHRRTHPEDKVKIIDSFAKVNEEKGHFWREIYRIKKGDGEYGTIQESAYIIRNELGEITRMVGAVRDITQRWYYQEMERLEKELLVHNAVKDKDVAELIKKYLLGIEQLHDGMFCAVLIKQGKHLYSFSASGLPFEYLNAIDGTEIAQNVGCAGTAAYLNQTVIVNDIKSDSRWDCFKELAENHGLRACCSYPLIDSSQDVIAVFSTYFGEPKVPTASEERTIERARQIIQIVMENFLKERALSESNQRYEYVTKATTEIIWDWDLPSGIIYWGSGYESTFGHKIEDNKTEITTLIGNIHPDDLEEVEKSLYDVVNGTETNWGAEYRYRKADGTYSFIIDKGFVLRDEKGRATRMVGAIRDISRKKKEELRLQLLETVVTNTSDVIIITEAASMDSRGLKILYVNEAFTKMTGYTAMEVINKTPHILQGPNSDVNEMAKLREAIKNFKPCIINTINYKKSGEEYWVSISVNPVQDNKGNYTHWVAIERDITKEKKEEMRLKQLESVITNMNESVVMTEANPMSYPGPKIVYVNEAFAKLSGYSIEEVIGQTPRILQGPLSNAEGLKQLREAFIQKKPCKISTVNYTKTHEPFWIEASISPVFDNNGNCINWVGIQRNVTDEKKSEAALNQLNDNLLKQAQKLEESNKELEQFAYVASHDLQEPLRMVTGFLTQLDKKYSIVLDDKGKTYIHFAVDGAKRMRQIILDLLEYSRVGRNESNKEEINLNNLINEIEILFRSTIDEHSASIKVLDNLPTIYTFKAPIRQVFQNLIGNALKYSKKGEAPIIEISVKELNSHWQFTIADNGLGIAKEYFDKIFIIFSRLHTKEEYQGTGLGLAITKKIIEKMGGSIWVESEEGVGSKFHFTFIKNK